MGDSLAYSVLTAVVDLRTSMALRIGSTQVQAVMGPLQYVKGKLFLRVCVRILPF